MSLSVCSHWPTGRPDWFPAHIEFVLVHALVVACNGLVHYRLLTNRPVTWRWMLFPSAMDMTLTTAGIVVTGGFESFVFLGYYAALAIFAAVLLLSGDYVTLSEKRKCHPG